MTNEDIAVRLEHLDQEVKSLKHRMTEQEGKDKILTELTISVKTLATNMEYMAKEQQRQGERLERLEHEPSENFKYYKRLVIGCVITSIIGIIVGAVFASIIK